MTAPRKASPRVLPTSPFNRVEPARRPLPMLVVGDRITHDRYGLGRVISVDGPEYVSVDFGGNFVRRIPLSSRALTKI